VVGAAWEEIATGERSKRLIYGEVAGIRRKPRCIIRTERD
jgi:hypothetical protein